MRSSPEDRIVFYKGIGVDCKDHPDGLASLVIARTCTHNCHYCINAGIHSAWTRSDWASYIVSLSLRKSLTNCIVLGGLEWTEQEDELYVLLDSYMEQGANVILYTHWSEEEIEKKFPKLLEYDMYIKFGEYRPKLASSTHSSYGIPLASTNQYIKRVGKNASSGNKDN